MKKLFLALMALMASVTANAEAFDLWIAGTQVTTENQDDVLGDGSVKYYDNSYHQLIIKDVTIQGGEFPAIKSGLDCTMIYIEGDVTLEGSIGLDITGEVSIYGRSKDNYTDNLTINATHAGIHIKDGNLQLSPDLKSFNVVGQEYGILGEGEAVLSYPYVHGLDEYWPETTIRGINQAAITGLQSSSRYPLYLPYISIVEPANTALIKGTIVDENNNAVKGDVALRFAPVEYYHLQIAGVWVNSVNAHKLRSDDITGNISYDPDTSTITLEDAEIFSTRLSGISIGSDNDNINIAVKGDCSIISSEDYGIYYGANGRIYGLDNNSALNLRCMGEYYPALFLYNSVTIDNIEFNAKSNSNNPTISGKYTISGEYISSSKLIIGSNTDLTSTASVIGVPAISVYQMDLGTAVITYPEGAIWSEESHYVLDADGNPASKVVISTEDSGVADIKADASSAEITDIYTIDGRRVAEPSRGINIVRRADGSCSKILVK